MRKKKCKDCQEFFHFREFSDGRRYRVRCHSCYNKKAREYYHQSKGRTQPKPLETKDFIEENRMAIVRLGEQRYYESREKGIFPII